MQLIVLAGGLGSRLSEETESKPKPLIEIGGKPILWHIFAIFSRFGIKDFVISTGYKSEMISKYAETLRDKTNWRIECVNTGDLTATGGRILKCASHIVGKTFLATYGDGVGNINIEKLINFHKSHGRLATLTAVHPPARFGELEIESDVVTHFAEKNQTRAGWINGGFFVLESNVLTRIKDSDEPFESGALARLTAENQLMAFKHEGFWQPMDTLREKNELNQFALQKTPPWFNFS